MSPTPINPKRHALLIASLVGLASLTGCDDQAQTELSLNEAAREFRMLSAGTGPAGTDEYADQIYDEISADLENLAGSETGLEAAIAVLLSQAQQGQAREPGDAAATLEFEAGNQITVIRGYLHEYISLSALAEAAAQFDPEPEFQILDDLDAERRAETETFIQRKAEIDERLGQMRDQIDSLTQQATAERNTAGELQLQTTSVSAAEAAEIATRVREHTRRADNFAIEAERLRIRFEQLEPQSNEMAVQLERIDSQRELIAQSRDRVRARDDSLAEDVQRNRRAADTAATEIERRLEALRSFRAESVEPAAEEALRLIGSAISNARRARDKTPNSAKLATATAEQARAEFHLRRATGMAAYARLLESLAAAQPPLAQSSRYADEAEQMRQHEVEARDNAATSFDNAASAFTSIRARGETKAALDSAAETLTDLARKLRREPEAAPEDNGFEGGFEGEDTGDAENVENVAPEMPG